MVINATFELLASLPAPPFYAVMDELVSDLGLGDRAQVRQMLKAAHVRTTQYTRDGQKVVEVDQLDWQCMQQRIIDYWNRVYGE